MSQLSQHRLTKWRRLLLIRDASEDHTARCVMCNVCLPVWRVQAHHIYPKALYPARAYQLHNGVCLCVACHVHIVHGGNTFRDVTEEGERWRFFVPSFLRHCSMAVNRDFNLHNQERV